MLSGRRRAFIGNRRVIDYKIASGVYLRPRNVFFL